MHSETATSRLDPIGATLVEREVLSEAALRDASEYCAATGVALPDALVAHGLVGPEDVAAAKADTIGLGYADPGRDPPDPKLARSADVDIYLKYRILPWRRVGKLTAYVTSEPETAGLALSALEPVFGMGFCLVASRSAMDQAILTTVGPELAERASVRTPADLSVRTLGLRRYGFVAVLGLLIVAFVAMPALSLAGLGIALLVLSITTTITRLAALLVGHGSSKPKPVPEGAVPLAGRRPLPRISLLIPLYREAGMIRQLVHGLEQLDYPKPLLDVKLLLEADDLETQQAAARSDLPAWVTPLVLPDGAPRTKPRAMNLALDFCKGDLIGIFDAEDRPDPDQLRVVADHFRAARPDVACVQCQLAYFNARENWVTRCFQIEYSIWFDVLLRGWQRLGLPIPLGGTSVYFRRAALQDLGGWDAHNVTEDADLGMRLARRGLRTDVVTSTTLEEANCRILPWIRQRSRWLKGYMMTWLTHMRDPVRLWRDLGPVGFFGFQVLFLGGAASYLAMPLFWAALALTVLAGRSVYGEAMPDWALTALGIALIAGQVVMLAAAWLALWRRRLTGLSVWVPSLLIYWTMGAAAAWKAVVELAVAPYFWDKTRHGLTRFLPGQRM